jgi:hypothetical protein
MDDILISGPNTVLNKLDSLLESYHQRSALLQTELRLSARLLWMRHRAGQIEVKEVAGRFQQLHKRIDAAQDAVQLEITRLKEDIAKLRNALKEVEGSGSLPPAPAGASAVAIPSDQFGTLEFVTSRDYGGVLHVTDQATGVDGDSDLYFFDIQDKTHTRLRLIAKFDLPNRAEREWRSIAELRLLKLPENIILPEQLSHPDDGVIVFKEALARRGLTKAVRLSNYLREYLIEVTKSCADCIGTALEHLAALHTIHPGEFRELAPRRKDRSCWRDVLPKSWSGLTVGGTLNLEQICRQHWPQVISTTGRELLRPSDVGFDRTLPDPIEGMDRTLCAHTGLLRVSRIHGDLNLTNLLVVHHRNSDPIEVFIIDIANSERELATALDFARLEVALWLDTYLGFAKQLGDDAEQKWLADMVRIRDFLDGRTRSRGGLSAPGASQLVDVIHALRHKAFSKLSPEDEAHRTSYILDDFFHCLYFTFLSMLRHDSIQKDPVQVRAILLGASLTRLVLNTFKNYSQHANPQFTRPWIDPPNYNHNRG